MTTTDVIDDMNGKLVEKDIQLKELKNELSSYKGIQHGQAKAL